MEVTVHTSPLQSREEARAHETPISVHRHHSRSLIESRSQDGRNRKERGTLSRSLRLPHHGRAASWAYRRDASRTRKDKGQGAQAPLGPWRRPSEGKCEWGLRQPSRWVCSASTRSGGSGWRARLRGHQDATSAAGILRAPGASQASAYPSCALLGGRRALQAVGGDAGDPEPRRAASAVRPTEAQ